MSIPIITTIENDLVLGDAFPSTQDVTQSSKTDKPHLFVSMADLIQDQIFFHPSMTLNLEGLSALEKTSIDSIVAGSEVSDYFVQMMCSQIEGSIRPHHERIRVCLNSMDSQALGSLIGGGIEEPEENPALGLRGVIRYASKTYAAAFSLECEVVKALRDKGINTEVVIPFVRTLADAATIIDKLAEQGLPRGLNGLKVLFSVDVPSSVILAERLLHYFDGVVTHLDNLAQFALGVDKMSERLENSFDPENEAVIQLIDLVEKASLSVKKPMVLVAHSIQETKKLHHYLAEKKRIDVIVTD
ncbi:putative PEP-binding protein [Vibrio sp. 10N.261.55.A7]|uniref:putative PEP-binding protein n=1 Tax=Vibrio sp. 10N.261.55.A7 TaxID=1880851 RepID=UPI000C83F6C5|nr:putative PEP-binding protein [Vibrio sp. 10N.261.55.A7]PMJ92003.1 phosphoenolpyruvate synthase [Vibrio sp. 10N.261.55.A7]